MQNLMMILLIVVAVVTMVLGGWVSFANLDESATITIHKEAVKQDTESAIKKGETLVEDAAQQGRDLIDQTEKPKSDQAPSEALQKPESKL